MTSEILNPTVAQSLLGTRMLGHPLRCYGQVGSTQEIVRAAAQAGALEGLVVVASEQTAGRGRSGRTWWSPPKGGLYLSVLMRPNLAAEHASWLTMCLALGAAEGVEDVCGLVPAIKWPNDLLAGNRKLAGVLCETSLRGSTIDYAVAGLGLNVNIDFQTHPVLYAEATSLQMETGHPVPMLPLLARILERLEDHYQAMAHGVSPQPAWAQRLVTLGRQVQAQRSQGEMVEGQACGVLPDGALRIQLADGSEAIVRATDVTLRPSEPTP